jgi:hypothetical protein
MAGNANGVLGLGFGLGLGLGLGVGFGGEHVERSSARARA